MHYLLVITAGWAALALGAVLAARAQILPALVVVPVDNGESTPSRSSVVGGPTFKLLFTSRL